MPIDVLVGPAGAGKTLLALDRTNTGSRSYFDPYHWNEGADVHFVSAHDESSLAAGLTDLARRLAAKEAARDGGDRWHGRRTPEDRALSALMQSPGNWVLLLDGLDDPRMVARAWTPAGLLRRNLRRASRNGFGQIIVTSRLGDREAWPPWVTVAPVGPLSAPSAGEQLRRHGGAAAGTSKEVEQLAVRLGGHPLTLRIAGNHLQIGSTRKTGVNADAYRDYEALLDAGAARRGVPGPGTPQLETLAAVCELALDLAARRGIPRARLILRLLSCFAAASFPSELLVPQELDRLIPGLCGDRPDGDQAPSFTGGELQMTVQTLRSLGLLHTFGPDRAIDRQDRYLALDPAVAQAQRDALAADPAQAAVLKAAAVELLHRQAVSATSEQSQAWWWPVLLPHVEALGRNLPAMDRACAERLRDTADRVAAGLRHNGQVRAAVLLRSSIEALGAG
ncbi:hypothetical protein FNH09_01705 [Streptomyces adustus]|uniref:Uncharacterized protein n=1 Tax=Streptomyces adustus TaxID=1609272 RepID=A0A5N8V643_9ACTN|nr:hypothetical protein [Streptomyces adustus]MPY30082.1 hypothetical protein [Streptomyces adustus]